MQKDDLIPMVNQNGDEKRTYKKGMRKWREVEFTGSF
jgi:hypothetical protein